MPKRRVAVAAPGPVAPLPPAALVQVTPPPLPTVRPGAPMTQTGAAAVPPVPQPTVGGPGTQVRRVVLELSDGTQIAMRGTVILGRLPSDPTRYAHALALPDSTRTLSRDHLEVGLTPHGQVWVSDLGSANGTYVSRGRSWTRLSPHQRIPVDAEDVLRFADYALRVRVEA